MCLAAVALSSPKHAMVDTDTPHDPEQRLFLPPHPTTPWREAQVSTTGGGSHDNSWPLSVTEDDCGLWHRAIEGFPSEGNKKILEPNMLQPVANLSDVWEQMERQGVAMASKADIVAAAPALEQAFWNSWVMMAHEEGELRTRLSAKELLALQKLFEEHILPGGASARPPVIYRRAREQVSQFTPNFSGYEVKKLFVFHRDPLRFHEAIAGPTHDRVTLWWPSRGELDPETSCVKQFGVLGGYRFTANFKKEGPSRPRVPISKEEAVAKASQGRLWISPGSRSDYVLFFRNHVSNHSGVGTMAGSSLNIPVTLDWLADEHRGQEREAPRPPQCSTSSAQTAEKERTPIKKERYIFGVPSSMVEWVEESYMNKDGSPQLTSDHWDYHERLVFRGLKRRMERLML